MNKINLWYWIVTGLFAAFMLFSGITNAMVTPESVTAITALGYPKYFVAFIGVAKVLGVIAILLPNLRRLKEWAYAGLFFDLLGVAFSVFAIQNFKLSGEGVLVAIVFVLLLMVFLFLSYYLWHKKIGTV